MDARIKELVDVGEKLFSSRFELMSYWQETAEIFYPERATFTARVGGGDMYSGLMSSEPALVRRELANALQGMLRPDGTVWFGAHVEDEMIDEDIEARAYLEYVTKVQLRAMYHRPARFTIASKGVDNDWVTFGMAPMTIDVRRDYLSLIYNSWHVSDLAWSDNEYGEVECVYHQWKPTMRQLVNTFGDAVHSNVKDKVKEEPNTRVNCYRIVTPRDKYENERRRTPKADWGSLYIDVDNDHVIEEVPYYWNPFIIPRWTRVSGSQYAWSPCTGPGLADGRTLQAIMRILLESGEKAVDPPMLAKMEAIRSDINLYSGGLTSQAEDYDERVGGDALRPITRDNSGFPVGLEMHDRFSRILTEGFFLNKIRLPQDATRRTAYETRKLFEEHIRSATPMIAPAEDEVNGQICERTFEALSAYQAFGPPDIVPDILRGREIRYEFISPLREMQDEMESQKLAEAIEILAPAAKVDPAQMHQIDWDEAVRGALKSRHIPAKWRRSEEQFAQIKQAISQQQQQQQQAEEVAGGAEVAGMVGDAAQKLLPVLEQQ